MPEPLFAKFLRTPFLTEHLRWLQWNFQRILSIFFNIVHEKVNLYNFPKTLQGKLQDFHPCQNPPTQPWTNKTSANFPKIRSPAWTRNTAQKMKFSIKDFFSKCDQIRRKLRIWPHLLKKSFMENFGAVTTCNLTYNKAPPHAVS